MLEKKTIYTALAVTAITGLAVYLMRLKNLSETIQTRFRSASKNPSKGSFTVNIDLVNPSAGQLNVKGVTGQVFYGQNLIAIYNSKAPFFIRPNSVTPLSLNFSTVRSGLLNMAVEQSIKTQIQPILIRYQIQTNLGNIPQEFTVNPAELV
jgi:hypothetical protein